MSSPGPLRNPTAADIIAGRISISVAEAAKILGVSRKHAYRLVATGKLPGAYRMGGRILVHIPTLLREIEALATKISGVPTPADTE